MYLGMSFRGQNPTSSDALLDCDTVEKLEKQQLGKFKMLHVAQNIVYSVSGGKKWTPGHILLGVNLPSGNKVKTTCSTFS